MKLIFSVFKYYFGQLSRHVYWIVRLMKAELGENVQLHFPIICEGSGNFILGDNSIVQKNAKIGVGKESMLSLGNESLLEKGSTIIVNKKCQLNIGAQFKLGANARLYIASHWVFGDNVKIETHCSIFAREAEKAGRLKIGSNSNIGDYTIMDVVDDINIGNDVAIGPNCTIYTHDHLYTNKDLPAWEGGLVSHPVTVEDGAWVGSGVTILPGVTIGKRAVVAAGSVITKSVESNTIVGGIPAKLIKRI